MRKADLLFISVQNRIRSFLSEERGESNIIAIVIVLGIVVTLALTFGTKINELFTTWWNNIATTP